MKKSTQKLKKITRVLFGRTAFVIIAILMQFAFFFILINWLYRYSVLIHLLFVLLGMFVVIHIFNEDTNSAFKMAWIIPVLIIPIFGTMIYVFVNLQLGTKIMRSRLASIDKQLHEKAKTSDAVLEKLESELHGERGLASYLHNAGDFPAYYDNDIEFFPLGEFKFEEMKKQLMAAEKFIFMEYFIIEEGIMFNSILSILEEKVKQGVEVRIMYDDMGSLGTLPASYAKQLEKKGIKAVSFNRISPIINTIMNHRDHRKILVIDGKVAFSGGANLADEYINKKVKYGHWMDNIICVRGKAVWSYLVMFLTNWNALRHEDEDYTVFKNSKIVDETSFDGYIAPYAETPLDQELTGQSVYEDLLNSANEYVYIMTPYLIIDSEMINTLIHTAKKGVDVRIIMPGIADKQIIHDMGTTYYAQLIQGGVKIYEYGPGFVHSKVFISDDTYATVGTINLDYRSLYLHFENGTLLYKSKKILDVKQNFMDTLSKCKEIQIEDTHVNIVKGLFLSIIRIFSPLL